MPYTILAIRHRHRVHYVRRHQTIDTRPSNTTRGIYILLRRLIGNVIRPQGTMTSSLMILINVNQLRVCILNTNLRRPTINAIFYLPMMDLRSYVGGKCPITNNMTMPTGTTRHDRHRHYHGTTRRNTRATTIRTTTSIFRQYVQLKFQLRERQLFRPFRLYATNKALYGILLRRHATNKANGLFNM